MIQVSKEKHSVEESRLRISGVIAIFSPSE